MTELITALKLSLLVFAPVYPLLIVDAKDELKRWLK